MAGSSGVLFLVSVAVGLCAVYAVVVVAWALLADWRQTRALRNYTRSSPYWRDR